MMKYLLLALALVCNFAFGAITTTGIQGPWNLYAGSGTGKVLFAFPSFEFCKNAPANPTLKLKAGDYTCRSEGKIKAETVVVPPPKPTDLTKTNVCTGDTAGTWQSVATWAYNAATNAWDLQAYLPTVAPAGSCVPKPAALTRTNDCILPAKGSWVQTQTYSKVNNAWVAGDWLPDSAPAGACVVPPVAETVFNWVTIAEDSDNPAAKPFNYVGEVRFGHPTQPLKWVTKTFNGAGTCSGQSFGNVDPAPGLYKQCQVKRTAPNVVQTGLMPVINEALVPPPQIGDSRLKVKDGGGFDVGPFDIGAFRVNCGVSHFGFNDPIVYPKQKGKSHHHMFFGNTGIDENSTTESVANTGNSTCSGGIANRTGYWIPTLVNLKNGAPVVTENSIWYYKGGYYGVPSESVVSVPQGLRMIAGDSSNTTKAGASPYINFTCSSTGVKGSVIPNCPVGSDIEIGIQFPQCWDGVNLDSPNHKSHMAYANGKGCPATHPVAFTEVSLNLAFKVTEERPDLYWKFSSDNYSGVGGYSFHADWFNGWKTDIMDTWIKNCINKKASSSNAICDGRYLE